MKKLLFILSLIISLTSFGQAINNTRRIFNVKLFGAKGDGVTDATTSIQAAINACNAAGGGTVFFPDGIYIIGGAINPTYNSQLYIPSTAITGNTRNSITLEGEATNLSNFGGGLTGGQTVMPTTAGAILKSTLATFTTAGQAVIGTTGAFNTTSFVFQNLGIQVKNNPGGAGPVVGGISWKNGANFIIRNCCIVIDTSGWRSTMPTNDISAIEIPDNNSGENYKIENTLVGGFRIGYKISEHVALSNVIAMTCYYAFYFKTGNHTINSQRVGTYWCAYDMYIASACILASFQLDTEWQQVGKWYDDIATIKDTANLATGQVFYTIIAAGTGKDNSKFVKTGGANLHTLTNDAGVSASSVVSMGDVIGSGTKGSIPYLGTGGVLRQNNAKLFWDSANVRLGIGTATPGNDLEIASSGNAAIRLNAGTNGQGVIVYNKGATVKWQSGMDFSANGTADFYIYDQVNGKAREYINTSGDMYLGGTASGTTTAVLGLKANGGMTLLNTNTTVGTTGAQTINKPSGCVNFAAGAQTLVVTNNLCANATAQIFVQVNGTDATATSARVTPTGGSFTITLNAAATAETRVCFWIHD